MMQPVGIALYIHQKTRSKEIIDTLYDLNLSISSNKVACIKHDVAAAVINKADINNSVYIPSVVSPSNRLYFAVDNTDMAIDTPDGKKQLHGTAMAVYQRSDAFHEQQPLKLNRTTKVQKSADTKPFYESVFCSEPLKSISNYSVFETTATYNNEIQLNSNKDLVWSLLKSVHDLSLNVPTWAGYNSLISDEKPTTTFCSIPVLNGSPTDWSNLYSALKIVQGIDVSTSPDNKTIISVDQQLYAKCIQLKSRNEISENFVFRMGELHIVFSRLKAIGKYIDSSGLDEVFVEAEIYGPATVEQLKRSFEAFLTLYIALFQLYINQFLTENPVVESDIRRSTTEAAVSLKDIQTLENGEILTIHKSMLDMIESTELLSLLEEFENKMQNQAKFLCNYIKMVKLLMLFVRATRESNWVLHLSSLDKFVKFFLCMICIIMHDIHQFI